MSQDRTTPSSPGSEATTPVLVVAGAWALVGVPLAYGLWQTVIKAAQLLG